MESAGWRTEVEEAQWKKQVKHSIASYHGGRPPIYVYIFCLPNERETPVIYDSATYVLKFLC